MIVYRVVKEFPTVKCGEDLLHNTKRIEEFNFERKNTEEVLEKYRIKNSGERTSRLTGIFVFPDDNLQERATHWASKFVADPYKSYQCFLIKLDVEDIQWHDSVYYEDLFNLKNNKSTLMQNRLSEQDLLALYWETPKDLTPITVEGLVNSAKVVSIDSCMVSHTSFRIVEKAYES